MEMKAFLVERNTDCQQDMALDCLELELQAVVTFSRAEDQTGPPEKQAALLTPKLLLQPLTFSLTKKII